MNDLTRTLLYVDVPKYFMHGVWNLRNQGIYIDNHVDGFPSVKRAHVSVSVRFMPSIHISETLLYSYLMLLGYHARGPQSFAHLKVVEGDLWSSFHETCMHALG